MLNLKINLSSLLVTLLLSVGMSAQAEPLQGAEPDAQKTRSMNILYKTSNHEQRLIFRLWLKLKNQDQLEDLLQQIYNPESPQYHHFLTNKSFNALFSPTKQDVDSIKRYLSSQGMEDVLVDKNKHYIQAAAIVPKIEHFFQAKMKASELKGDVVHINFSSVHIPAAIAGKISGISGLNTFPVPSAIRPHENPKHLTPEFQTPSGGLFATLTADLLDANNKILVPNMLFKGFVPFPFVNPPGYGYSVAQLRHAYGVDQLINQGIDGTGQTIVLPYTGGTDADLVILQSDLDYFSVQQSLPPITLIFKYPTNVKPIPSTNSCYDPGEITQDVQALHAFAPGATIVLSIEDCNSQLNDVVIDSIYKGYGNIISKSAGGPESGLGNILPLEAALMYAATTGVSVNFASGDSGDGLQKFGHKSIAYPASSQWATAVGGTSLFLDRNGDYLQETAWGNFQNTTYVCQNASIVGGKKVCSQYKMTYSSGATPFQGGSTGGISTINVAPIWQQNSISSLYAGGYGIIGTHRSCGVSQNQPCRATPDVSFLADGHTGMQGYRTINGTIEPNIADGTSLACPLFSAVVALSAQTRVNQGKSPLFGLVSAYLYSLPPGSVRPILSPHGLGNPVGGVPDPNAFQLYQVDATNGSLLGTSFSQDGILRPGPTWSDTNGVGTPYAPIFVPSLANS